MALALVDFIGDCRKMKSKRSENPRVRDAWLEPGVEESCVWS
jgi:hypothetical protein